MPAPRFRPSNPSLVTNFIIATIQEMRSLLLHGCYGEATPGTLQLRFLPQGLLLDEGEPAGLQQFSEALSRWGRTVQAEL